MSYRVTVEQSEIPYTADLHDGVVRLFVSGRLVGAGVWCFGRIMKPPQSPTRLGVPRVVAEALERELCEVIDMAMAKAA